MEKINRLLNSVCKTYELGQCQSQPKPCSGGLLHQIWQFDTTLGHYILKILNPSIIHQPDRPDRYRITELIARTVEKYVPAIPALTHQDDPLFQFENDIAMVFPYLKAHILRPSAITSFHAAKIGGMLAILHQADINIIDAPPVEVLAPNLAKTDKLVSTLSARAPPIAKQFFLSEKIIRQIISHWHDHEIILKNNTVISHRDCDPKNILWDEAHHYYIIDWESAGRINKTKDLVATAIYWSLDENYTININQLSAFLVAYQKNSGVIIQEEIAAGFYGLLGDWLGWLEFNFSRIRDCTENSAEFLLGKSEAGKTLVALPHLFNQFPVVLQIVRRLL